MSTVVPAPFAVRVESRGTVSAVSISGELDIASAPAVQEALDRAVEAASEILVVDLAGTSFVDSSGLEAIFRSERRATAAGVGMVVVGARPVVRRVFELSGLATRLSFA